MGGNWETRELVLHEQRQESSLGKLALICYNSKNSSFLVIGFLLEIMQKWLPPRNSLDWCHCSLTSRAETWSSVRSSQLQRTKGPKRFNMQCQQYSALKDICLLMTTTVENEEIETQRGKVTWSISNLKLETKGNGETLMTVWAADK